MTVLDKRLTEGLARSVPIRPERNTIYWCRDTKGFGVLVTPNGSRSWVMERRVDGDTKRRTLGKVEGRGAISADAARKEIIKINGEFLQGIDRLEQKREQARLHERDVILADALCEYVANKRRAKDGLPLTPRTKADYVAMVQPGGTTATGKPKCDGELFALADRRLSKITGDDVRRVYEQARKRGARRADYAMQVLRAVVNWHGVSIPENPLGKEVAGRDRIVLRPSSRPASPVPAERLGAFWRAACEAGRNGKRHAASADLIRFMLLTGARGGESHGSEYSEPIRVKHVDVVAGRIELPETKNRRSHLIFLSRQALDIVKEYVKDKQPDDQVFTIRDPGKTLHAICDAAGVERRSPHDMRDTFGSVAEGLVSAYTLQRMMNHTPKDVTGTSYIKIGDAHLRTGWQGVADYIEALAREEDRLAA